MSRHEQIPAVTPVGRWRKYNDTIWSRLVEVRSDPNFPAYYAVEETTDLARVIADRLLMSTGQQPSAYQGGDQS